LKVFQRKILFITGSRGEYGYIKPLLKMIDNDESLSYEIVVTNMHVLEEFGASEQEFIKDNLHIDYRIYNTLSGYNTVTMPKSLGIFLLQIPEIISKSKADIVLIAGDRGEMLMAAIASSHMNIPVAHIQAGEASGNIDGNIRHAITKISHIHFASNKDAYDRIINLGEEKFRVFNVGAPLVDELIQNTIVDNIRDIYNINKDNKMVLLVQHPVTEEFENNYNYTKNILEALNYFGQNFASIIVILPNSDAGKEDVEKAIRDYAQPNYHIFRNLPRSQYLGFVKDCDFMIGNSTSGLMEAPSFGTIAINIGRRQIGRIQGKNVINCDFHKESIIDSIQKAISKNIQKKIYTNPYGNGDSSKKILKILKTIKINKDFICKKITY